MLARALLQAALALVLIAPSAAAQAAIIPEQLHTIHDEVIAQDRDPLPLDHAGLRRLLDPHVGRRGLRRIELGRSAEGRRLFGYIAGKGPLRILIWSQADGTAPVGTLVLADLLRFVVSGDDDGLSRLLQDSLTIVALPLVNPDGAATGSIRNAHGVEILLDGRRRTTPEGRALTQLAESAPGAIAIGLEGVEGIGTATEAISLYVPAAPASGVEDSARIRAVGVAGTLASAVESLGRLGVWRSEPPSDERRIADFLQNAFRGVVVVGLPAENSHSAQARQIAFSALLATLHSMATDGVLGESDDTFSRLSATTPIAPTSEVDLLIRQARLRIPGLPSIVADIALDYQDASRRTGGRVVDVGDLSVEARDTLAVSGLEVTALGEMLTLGETGASRLTVGSESEAEFDLRRRTRTVLRTIFTMRGGTLAQPPDHQFPYRARWFVSLQPPFLAQEFSGYHEDADAALEEVGWPGSTTRPRAHTFRAWRMGIGRAITNTLAVEMVAGGGDRWEQSRVGLDGIPRRLEQRGHYAGIVASYEHRYLRVAGGPAVGGHGWVWTDLTEQGGRASGWTIRPGLIWEASASLPAGTRFAPELRVQQRSFLDAEIDGFGIIPGFHVRNHTFSVGLSTTARWFSPP